MREIETEGKTLEEALSKAEEFLNVPLEEIDYKILEYGREGILGIGTKPYRIYAKIKNSNENLLKDFLQEILKRLDVNAKIKVQKEEDHIKLSIEGENLGDLIGSSGKTLASLEFIIRLYASKNQITDVISLDIDHYRERKEKYLETLAQKVASKVKIEKTEYKFPPMTARERRIIHLTLQDDPDVTTYSEGEEPERRVIIAPKKNEK
ncbi:MAG TPA: RNA-binding cell elongation regulator Jag/EloR [Dictyoglomaceae bacterium]|nr:RNA-binding cell elongation regulator Jag/EloR [Dictyoglomaceae bacterium]HOL39988.1 RNA-binding cell elongation regulator Jag/EloR [Dictyoglomaceae bacterium]HOP95214.1 RNA-binding cell elongation regulator Jag/EloR [Dictyoglomaceae bacterium]HPP16578.1 RNA-binding cell elongation regulator Jag/EloR [Dictyoglomaceae bacterium]HPU43746.1 RNA-binding cell elongation regulator Jag/EloR [Dictyoglomaceae bacterium]